MIKGIAVNDTYVILNGIVALSPVVHYTQTIKDGNGKKRKIKHFYFDIGYSGNSVVRFERLRDNLKPHRDTDAGNVLIVYANEELAKVRDKIISILKR